MNARRIVVAPDSLKGSIGAAEAAAAIRRGWERARPGDRVTCLPMADGGEGTLAAVAAAVPAARRHPVAVHGPDGTLVAADWLELPDGQALVELASTSGLLLLPRDPRTGELRLLPLVAHTIGLGEALRAALDSGASHVHVAIGGSASSDGGTGVLTALGARFLDDLGRELEPGNAGLERLASVDLSGLRTLPPGGVSVWTDVRSPLLGDEGAVAVFGRQKGLSGAAAVQAERNLERLSRLLGGDPAQPGAGAAGGVGYGLASVGGTLTGGAVAVSDVIGLPAALADADAVITGEGAYDSQSAHGKVVSHVCALARAEGIPALLVAGRIDAETREFAEAVSLSQLAEPGQNPMRDAERLLEQAGHRLASVWR